MRSTVLAFLLMLSLSTAALAASPVPLVNYQGVLRDISGNPLDGSYEMTFRIYDAQGAGCPPAGGAQLYAEQHAAAGTGAVTVSGGLFDVAIGSGEVGLGSNLGNVFRTHTSVFLQIEIEGEVLCPRTQFLSAPSALNSVNAGLLDNRLPSEFIDTSATTQTKTGSFTLGGDLRVGATLFDTSASALIVSSDQDGDALVLRAGNDPTDGEMSIQGDGQMTFWSGNGTYQFWNGSTSSVQATILSDGTLVSGNALRLQAVNGPVYEPVPGGASRLANAFDDSDLFLYGGNDATDGSINIYGDSLMQLYSGDGRYTWNNGAAGGQETMYLDPAGNLQLDGDLTPSGGDLFLTSQPGVRLSSDPAGDLDAVANQDVELMLDRLNDGTFDWFRIFHDDSWALTSLLAEVHENGNLRVRGTITGNVSFDLAEAFLASEPVEPGDLVRVDPQRGDAVLKATADDGGAVIGVVSADPGVLLGGGFMDRPSLDVWGEEVGRRFDAQRPGLEARVLGRHPELARATADKGDPAVEEQLKNEQKIESLVLAEFGRESFAAVALAGRVRIKVDASLGPIHIGDALAASPTAGVAMRAASAGPIVGTALESLEQGQGSVLALIHRGYWAPESATAAAVRSTDAAVSADRPQPALPESGEAPEARAAAMAAARSADVYARSFRPSATELATLVRVVDAVETGDVLVIDLEEPGAMRRSHEAASSAVFGVVATSPGLVLGAQSGAPSEVPVALAGVVPCKVDAGYGAIRPGDLLTTSPTAGHAMRADDPRPGAVLGKALEALEAGTGTIKILVTLR